MRITLPDGSTAVSADKEIDGILSGAVGRQVTLTRTAPHAPGLEEYWPEVEGLAHTNTVTDEAMPPGLFFDAAVVHVLTTATLDRLQELYPQGRVEVQQVGMPCPRCVMTTLAQGDLPADLGILRAAAQHNQANVGVYASVAHAGSIRRGDRVSVARAAILPPEQIMPVPPARHIPEG